MLHFTEWVNDEKATNTKGLLKLIKELLVVQQNTGNRAITVMCKLVILHNIIYVIIVLYHIPYDFVYTILPVTSGLVTVLLKSLSFFMHYTMYCIYSNGSGRTGTFITIYTTLERIKTDGTVDIFQIVKSSRLQRTNFVANSVSGYYIL